MNDTIFQTIYDKLQDVLPTSWNELIFYAGYTTGSYSMKYYIKDDKSVFDCFSQPGLDRARLVRTFISIDKDLSAIRKNLVGKDKWTVLTMVVDSQGNMKTAFDYADISENATDYARDWEKKYL